ncbi:sulfatase-like hydrolase/transferase [Sediminitomix flava]|uniref:Putative secreted protein (Por secretion system target) n=1 Tax=Sediminitomix flava TaxID=379075 RepID=A0A315Z6P0_SEDFL|nr:sulfatase-like hydrolase/transferase [Sediminitomix flava]PWJ37937.1 putative secreted protein (Por secretion system target) [Sediminitomix flava]
MKQLKKLFLTLLFFGWKVLSLFGQDGNQPNILWIITDDQRADALSCYNQAMSGKADSPLGYVMSPNIDALAEEGVLFTNSFCTTPACAPSRAAMHSGQYAHHSGIYGFEYHHDGPDFVEKTIPQVLKSVGYHTARFGKLGVRASHMNVNGEKEDNDFYSFEVDVKDLQKAGYTDYYPHTYFDNGRVGKKAEWFYPDGTMRSYWIDREDGIMPEGNEAAKQAIVEDQELIFSYTRSNESLILSGVSSQPASMTADARITQAFQNYLSNANQTYKTMDGRTLEGANSAKPQFINLGYQFPHTPVLPPKSFRDRFKGKTYKVPTFSEAELEKLPNQLLRMYNELKIHPMTDEEKQLLIQDYYAFCAFGDSLIGEAVTAFKEYSIQNQQEYLIVIACGDHGWHLGEQGISAKFTPYTQSNKTAIIVVSSNKEKFPSHTVVSDYLEYVDFAPTFYASAGIDIKENTYNYLDGYDLEEVINGTKPARGYVLGEQNHLGGDRAYLRSENFAFSMKARKKSNKPKEGELNTLVTWPLTCSREDAELALFDLRVDKGEHNNVAYDEAYIELADWFRNKLGNIVLGDGRIECDWNKSNLWNRSNFAEGADDKVLDIPKEFIPEIETVLIPLDSVSISSYEIELEEGSSQFIPITFVPFNASEKELEWSSQDITIVSVQEGVITAVKEGETIVTLSLASDPNFSIEISVSVFALEEIEEEEEESKITSMEESMNSSIFKVFPNPSSALIQFSSEIPLQEVLILNTVGEKVKQIKMLGQEKINIEDLASGIYILRAVFEGGKISNRQLLIIE